MRNASLRSGMSFQRAINSLTRFDFVLGQSVKFLFSIKNIE